MLEPGFVMVDAQRGERTEILATPVQTGDRYRLHLTVDPGNGPPAHTHPQLTETFEIVEGVVQLQSGRQRTILEAGERAEVSPGTTHGFRVQSDRAAVMLVDVVFGATGPTDRSDLLQMAAALDQRVRAGDHNRVTGMPSLLQTAVIFDFYKQGFAFPGPSWLQAGILAPLARWGRRRGLTAEVRPFS